LLGFINPLSDPPTFQETPALRYLLEAHRNPDKPYFLCLDEMNLARPEHYFAPFLSAMEGERGVLAIHAGEGDVDAVPASISWPRNLFVVGTVNMDETTHPFSDKVLDRAFTFEFWDVDFDEWEKKASAHFAPEIIDYVLPILKELYSALKPARRHFGYRSCDEVVGFCATDTGLDAAVVLDAALYAKVLLKIRGEADGALSKALEDAATVCAAHNLKQSRRKIDEMRVMLTDLGTVRFWS
jgi:hypothetical protein